MKKYEYTENAGTENEGLKEQRTKRTNAGLCRYGWPHKNALGQQAVSKEVECARLGNAGRT